ncbi:MAG: EamA family transporter, partial [Deltaproteobacteria bacterium]|nr:EamA family transporter [Deltaproteobacteria bacterium]
FGVIFVIRPGMGIAHWAVVLPLLSAFFYATILIATRILGQRENVLTTLFYTSVGGLILSNVMVLFFWKTPSLMQWLLLMWLGMLGAVGHFFMIKAFEKTPASLLAAIIISSGLYLVRRETSPAVV